MLPNAFIDKPEQPTEDELAAELGPGKTLWDQLLAALADEHGIVIREWHSYSRKAGWSLRLKLKKRTILYLAPCRGSSRVAFILGGKAVQAARQSGLPPRVLKIIDEAPRYPEGTAVRLDIKRSGDIAVVQKLAALKLAN